MKARFRSRPPTHSARVCAFETDGFDDHTDGTNSVSNR
jgi:hypothetical protein